jgi:hypothetical protein
MDNGIGIACPKCKHEIDFEGLSMLKVELEVVPTRWEVSGVDYAHFRDGPSLPTAFFTSIEASPARVLLVCEKCEHKREINPLYFSIEWASKAGRTR